MSDSRLAADQLNAAVAGLGRGLNLPKVSACELMAQRLNSLDQAPDLPRPQELEALRKEIAQWCARSEAATLPIKLLRKTPLVLWNGDNPAASIGGLCDAFWAAAARREPWLGIAIEAWLRDFAPAIPGFTEAGITISVRLRNTKHPRLIAWARADRQFELFDSSKGPRTLGLALLGNTQPVPEILAETGMDHPLRAQGRFFRTALDAMLDALPSALGSPAAAASWQRAAPLLEVVDDMRDRLGNKTIQRRLRFEAMEGRVARACLGAWLQHREHVSAPRAAVLSYLVATIGDPRLRPTRWTDAGEDATRLVRSWLSKETLNAFLSLISNSGDTQQWRYRQAFWRACLDKVPGAEVWVVLGRDLARHAKVVADLRGSFGQMNSGDQAVLLMRLGDIVVSEWSNVGSLRAWDVADPRCPRLNKTDQYSKASLRAPCLEFPEHGSVAIARGHGEGGGLAHKSPERGLWQGRAAALLRAKTGVSLTPNDYRIK